ncbi:hypothetical protein [Sphingomonas sp. Leaf257]|jgi:hypothetical protein|uniref:hypothetical protein n=1 Tax=Sphingomonas sp. Leaf257 TaxID=1736309 RepID=UPI000A3EB3D2|nr:hypothetical protein [Sphingomonas sp. Leaf257]
MDRELQHPMADLLAKLADEWFRFYGDTETQLAEMRAVIEFVARDRLGMDQEE